MIRWEIDLYKMINCLSDMERVTLDSHPIQSSCFTDEVTDPERK